MKKVITVLVVLISLYACKHEDDKQNGVQHNLNTKSAGKREQLLKIFSEKTLSGASCGEQLISIRKLGFSDDEAEAQIKYGNFSSTYKDYLSTSTIGNKSCGTDDYFYFNVTKFVIDSADVTKKRLASFLNRYSKSICTKDMYVLIECIHKIDDAETIAIIKSMQGSVPEKHKLSFSKIKSMIAGYKGDYDNDNYLYYLNFEFDWKGNITFKLSETFKPTGDYYSLPFIRSIYEINKSSIQTNDMDTKIEFFELPLFSAANQIVMALKLDNGSYAYYDFSQIPPISTTAGSMFKFSPL